MSDARGPGRIIEQARPLLRPAVFVAYFAFIVSGRFDHLEALSLSHYLLASALLFLLIFELIFVIDPESCSPARLFWLGAWLMVAVRLAVQATGGVDSHLYPLAYLFFAVLASVLGLFYGAVLWLLFMGMEAGRLALAGGGAPWWKLAAHGGYLAAFGAAMGLFVFFERRSRRQTQQVLDRLKRDASEFQRDDTVHRLAGLTEGGRKKEALRSVFALDEAFYQALAGGREMLGADTLALYWRQDAEGPLHLREICSGRDDIVAEAEIAPGSGLLGWVAEHKTPLVVSGRKKIKSALPYYGPSAKPEHMIAVPVKNNGKVHGVLAADREDGVGFSGEDQKLMSAIASQVSEIHAHALLMKRSAAEAAQFKSLAELTHRLSQTLNLDDILESVMRTSKAITDFDAAAVLLPGDDGGHWLAAGGGDLERGGAGKPVATEGTLAGWVMSERQNMLIPDLDQRAKKTPVLGKRLDPPAMRSVLVHPLLMPGTDRGALAFFSREPEAFSRYVVSVSGMLADIAAVSIHNSLLYRDMERQAITDGLTGLYNHRWFQGRLAEEIERAGRLGVGLAVVLSDIDHFKRVNDAHGHPVGDEVLKGVARTIMASIRKVDSAARYGGEEFVLILVGSDKRGAFELAERLRKQVNKLVFHAAKKEFRVSLSLGISAYPEDARAKEDLIELADQALYHAKETGRNRTVLAGSPRKKRLSPA